MGNETGAYYGVRPSEYGWCAIVYTYDESGWESVLYKSRSCDDEASAIDDAVEWMDKNGVEAELE